MKFPKPFFRKSKQAWYLQVGKKQVSLGKDRDAAFERYRQIMLHERGQFTAAPTALTVDQVSDLFLEHSQRHNEPTTYEWYKQYLQDFCDRYGSLVALELKPFHVNRWLDKHAGWGDGSRRCAITAIKRAFNWAEGEGILPANPVKRVRKPSPRSRDRILTPTERQEIFASIKDQAFRDFVFALQETGCRPSEVRQVTAKNVDLVQGIWIFTKHKTFKKTRKPRFVYLTQAMLELSRRLVAQYPTGVLFRGPRSKNGFTRNGLRCRFRSLRKKLPHLAGVISYTYRHTFATDALENGVGVAEVAELLGHKGTEMVMQHYQHLSKKREHMRQAAVKATRAPGGQCA
jgi:integrase